jgi:hypothetical protein
MNNDAEEPRRDLRPVNVLVALFPLAILLLALALTGCGGGQVPCPLADGDTFEYRGRSPQTGVVSHIRYEVEKQGSGFIVRRYHALETPGGKTPETHLANVENVCDKYGRVKKRASGKSAGDCKGNHCFLWLPPSNRRVGATVKLSEDAREASVVEEMNRDRRTVLKVTAGSRTWYYDKISGYLVEDDQGKLVRTSKGPI